MIPSTIHRGESDGGRQGGKYGAFAIKSERAINVINCIVKLLRIKGKSTQVSNIKNDPSTENAATKEVMTIYSFTVIVESLLACFF